MRKVVDTVNDLDNVLYEIVNEAQPESTAWQYHMIEFVKRHQRAKPKQHPVGMTPQRRKGNQEVLFNSPADWISPDTAGGYRTEPPAADGRKVLLSDTDHLWGLGGNEEWVWKSFLRGMNPIFMDPYDGVVLGQAFDPRWEPVRRSMGYTHAYAERMNLAAMTPHDELSSTGYCLANPGTDYLVYLPQGGSVDVDLTAAAGNLWTEWFVPSTGLTYPPIVTKGGGWLSLEAPFSGAAVLYITSHATHAGAKPRD
ncbi:MAG: hypothetical protein HYS04_20740 [Acidobacteria bacterium]|nr:hypothetical protein [Acidobacteriota bacterium]